MNINLHHEPFSYRGSYMAISHIGRENPDMECLYLRCVHGLVSPMEVFSISLLDENGEKLAVQEEASHKSLKLISEKGYVSFCFENANTLRLKGKGCRLLLEMKNNGHGYDSAVKMSDHTWQINSATHRTNYLLSNRSQNMKIDAPWNSVGCSYISAIFYADCNEIFEGQIKECFLNPEQPIFSDKAFELCEAEADDSFRKWFSKMPQAEEKYRDARELAAYVMWSSYVAPFGNYKREAMLMSKNWMNNVWSWDHCFNAMALWEAEPKEGFEQFAIVFDNQHESGALPDYINDASLLWSFTKTPIHGWTLNWMLEHGNISELHLENLYKPLEKVTNWWFQYRDYDHDGMPQCNHGNDSVSDNCTPFDRGGPLESPVLSAFLILQMDVLTKIAEYLGYQEDAAVWKQRADKHMEKFLQHFWADGEIVARISGSHDIVRADSNYMYIPIVLGKRLPEDVRTWLIEGLGKEGYILTKYGLATESPKSPFYESNSYCRGPIWAPTTLIMVDGLMRAGEVKLAKDIAERFCEMVKNSHMAECFDALTGEAYRDPSYTWTASVFLVLSAYYLTGEENETN